MIPLFLGLQAANHLLLLIAFGAGLWFSEFRGGAAGGSDWHGYHVGLGIMAGLFCTFAHVGTYMYFMATFKWLRAATEKAGLDPRRFAQPARRNKSRSFPLMMGAIAATMLAMFAGAAADPTAGAWWPGQVHLVVAAAAIAINFAAAARLFMLVREQGRLMDGALAILNADPKVTVIHA